jgi:hypothetical protein
MTFFDVVNPMLAALPDIVYRVSILGSYRMDPRLLLAGMTEGEREPRHRHAGMTKEGWIPAYDWRG